MNKQELIEKYKNILDKSSVFAIVSIYGVLDDLEQLDEPEKVVIPQFVADWIEYCKVRKITLAHALYHSEEAKNKSVSRWLFEDLDNQETFARAWLDGYEVEQEKRYIVSLKNGQPLVKAPLGGNFYFNQNITAGNYKATRKQLEDANFGWVFDCEGIEIEEVE